MYIYNPYKSIIYPLPLKPYYKFDVKSIQLYYNTVTQLIE